jgi:hypothetical protein
MDFSNLLQLIQKVDWATISNIAVVITAVFVLIQLAEARRTTHAQSYSVVREILQEEKVRKARKLIFQLQDEGKAIEEWNKDKIESAEIICHTYDSVGQMIRHKLLFKDIIIDSWGPSLRRIWPILLPLISKYRSEWSSPEIWDDFEWLARIAIEKNEKQLKKEYRTKSIRQVFRKISLRNVLRNRKKTSEKD